MRKLFIALLALGAILPGLAAAHEVQNDGNMSVLLHMEPQDSPIVGQEATLYFSFTEASDKFQVLDCDCQLKISNGNNVVKSLALSEVAESFGANVYTTTVTFPKKGVYTVDLAGKSKTAAFADFHLNWFVRIERTDAAQTPIDPKVTAEDKRKMELLNRLYVGGLGVLAIGAIVIVVINIRKNRKTS
jgi:hypothetical protein